MGGNMIIKIKDVDVNYEVFGDGDKTLLILHGWMASIPAMAPIWQYFGRSIPSQVVTEQDNRQENEMGQKKPRRKVVVLDFPGQGGKSSALKEAWGVPEYAEMVREFMQALNMQKPDVIGHSFGGRVVIYLASQYPDIFDKIILTDAAGLKRKPSFQRWFKIKSYRIGKLFLKLFSPKEKYEEAVNQLRKKYGSSDYASLKSDMMRETFQKVIQLDLRSNLKKIQSPCLLIWGEKDEDTPLYMAKIMEKEIKDSGLVVLKDAGHFSYLDAPNQYNLIVENFLGG